MSIISTPSQEKKLTAEELQDIKQLRKDYTDLALALGELELQKLNLNKEKEKLTQQHSQLYTKEINLANTLTEKYGKGVINTETGIIN